MDTNISTCSGQAPHGGVTAEMPHASRIRGNVVHPSARAPVAGRPWPFPRGARGRRDPEAVQGAVNIHRLPPEALI